MSVMTEQVLLLFILALPVACFSWTLTKEEVFREPREWLTERSRKSEWWLVRKFCFALTCEYCLSHYIAAGIVAVVDYQMFLFDWRGYVLAWLCLVAVSNVYLSAYSRLRVEIRKDRAESTEMETRIKKAG